MRLLLPLLYFTCLCHFGDAASRVGHHVVTIGCLVDMNSTVGKVAQQAMDMAVLHINREPTILNGCKLELQVVDTGSNPFLGAAAASQLLERKVVAIAGPQSSSIANFVAHMATATQIPLVSFSATDPALSRSEYPYFFRTVPSDASQMAAVAALVDYFGWKEIIALYTDDDLGINGMAALTSSLRGVGARLAYKEALDPVTNKTSIARILTKLGSMGSQVFVVHASRDVGLLLFGEAYHLGMMSLGYAWIVTDSVLATLDAEDLDSHALKSIQGIIGTRSYIPNSPRLQSFISIWKDFQLDQPSRSQLNVYGMYAYDSIWMIAYAIDNIFRKRQSFNFVPLNEKGINLKKLREGPLLQYQISQMKFNGTSGPIEIDRKGDNLGSGFEFVNMVGNTFNVIGYWTNESGISAFPPATVHSPIPVSEDYLHDVVWPGNSIDAPRAGLISKDNRHFRIAVPQKAGYEQFVAFSNKSGNPTKFRGFCIDVFEDVLKYLPYTIHYEFVPYGNDSSSSLYEDMIIQLANKAFDAVVGDVTITAKRLELVDFTQPYVETGLVIVVPRSSDNFKKGWVFLQPFTLGMWLTTGGFFIFTGIVIWVLEHKSNDNFKGPPRKQIGTALWFTFSTLYYTQKEDIQTILGLCFVIIWLFFILIVTSSYTASLTSMLTVQQLSPSIQNIQNLQESDVPIGYQEGSFVRDYLISLGINQARLKPLNTLESYANALNLGPENDGVAAIVDELPYVQVFLASKCEFTTVGQPFTKEGWGFAFRKDLELATDFSAAILTIAEDGGLQRIHDFWLNKRVCESTLVNQSEQLDFTSFWVLFLVFGLVSISSLLIYNVRKLWHSYKKKNASCFLGKDELKTKWTGSRFFPRQNDVVQVAYKIEDQNISTTHPAEHSESLKEKVANSDGTLSHNHVCKKIRIANKVDHCSSDGLSENNRQSYISEQTLSNLIQHGATGH